MESSSQVLLTEEDKQSITRLITENEDVFGVRRMGGPINTPNPTKPTKTLTTSPNTLNIHSYTTGKGEKELDDLKNHAVALSKELGVEKTSISIVRAGDLYDFLLRTTNRDAIFIIDCRTDWDCMTTSISPGKRILFKNAAHLPMQDGVDNNPLATLLKAWMTNNPSQVRRLLSASHVVIHCVWGQSRSPASVVEFERIKLDKNLLKHAKSVCGDDSLVGNRFQSTVLLAKGFKGIDEIRTVFKQQLEAAGLSREEHDARERAFQDGMKRIFQI